MRPTADCTRREIFIVPFLMLFPHLTFTTCMYPFVVAVVLDALFEIATAFGLPHQKLASAFVGSRNQFVAECFPSLLRLLAARQEDLPLFCFHRCSALCSRCQ